MDSVRARKLLVVVILAATAIIAVYGAFSPVPGSGPAALVLVLLAVLLVLGVEAAEKHDPHQINLVQEKSYRITVRSVLATALVTGIVLLGTLYAAGAVIGLVTAVGGYEPFAFQLFGDAVSRLQLLLAASPSRILAVYASVAVVMGLGFWVLYPYLPTQDEELAGPLAFVASWSYLLAAAAVFTPLPLPEPAALALDAALIAFWGHIFALAYEGVEQYVL